MSRTIVIVFALAALALAASLGSSPGEVVRAPGVLAPTAPQQTTPPDFTPIRRGRHTLTPVARFEATARVLAREDYRFDDEARLSPTDLALGWNRMSDTKTIDALTITQSGRWYRFFYLSPPIPHAEIVRSSANMHFIPADDTVAATLAKVRVGDVVVFRGLLVDVARIDGWRWTTSRSRDDTGDGSCEVVYVEALSVR